MYIYQYVYLCLCIFSIYNQVLRTSMIRSQSVLGESRPPPPVKTLGF